MVSRGDIMLLGFKVKNYKSIKGELFLDLEATSLTDNESFVMKEGVLRILPAVALFGANASGKSNIIEAMKIMFDTILNSLTISTNETSILKSSTSKSEINVPFLFDESTRKEATEYEIRFVFDNKIYKYGFAYIGNIVCEEWLYEQKISKNSTVEKGIFYKINNEITYANKFSKLKVYNTYIKGATLLLTFLGQREENETVFFKNILESINLCLAINLEDSVVLTSGYMTFSILGNFYFGNKEAKIDMIDFLKTADNTIEDVEIIKSQKLSTGDDYEYDIFVVRKGIKLNIINESSGTKKLFSLHSFIDATWVMDRF